MSSVIQRAMVNILAPLAAKMAELEERSEMHNRDIDGLQERAEASGNKLDQHSLQLTKMMFELSKAETQLRIAHDAIQDASDKHTNLQGDYDATRTLVSHLDSGHKEKSAQLGELQRCFEELDGRVRLMQCLLSETNTAHLNINDRLSELRNRMEGLNDRHLELLKTVQATRQAEESCSQALRRYVSTFEQMKRESHRSLTTLDERTKGLEVTVVELSHAMDGSQRWQKVMKADWREVKGQLDGVFGAQRRTEGAADGAAAGMPRDVHGRLHKIEEQVMMLSKAVVQDSAKTSSAMQNLNDVVSKYSDELAHHRQSIESLDKAARQADSRLVQVERYGDEQAAKGEHLKELVRKTEGDIRLYVASVQKETDTALLQQKAELSDNSSALLQMGQRLDLASLDVHKVQGELQFVNASLTKLSVGVDLAHEYFQGLTKGFQDTHRRVAAPDGLRPLKASVRAGSPMPQMLPPVTQRMNSL